jgi:hypothetical protein
MQARERPAMRLLRTSETRDPESPAAGKRYQG